MKKGGGRGGKQGPLAHRHTNTSPTSLSPSPSNLAPHPYTRGGGGRETNPAPTTGLQPDRPLPRRLCRQRSSLSITPSIHGSRTSQDYFRKEERGEGGKVTVWFSRRTYFQAMMLPCDLRALSEFTSGLLNFSLVSQFLPHTVQQKKTFPRRFRRGI